MKSQYWYINFPTDAGAIGPVYFEQPADEAEVREYARKFDGCTRLPEGFECWPTRKVDAQAE
jgi:hypothetical protein